MAKKKADSRQKNATKQDKAPTLADSLQGDTLEKLKNARRELAENEKAEEEARRRKAAAERREREKNMSFGELLDKYGDGGSKY